jgi:hypothetical protein
MLTSQRKTVAIQVKSMTLPTRIVIRSRLPRARIWALAVTAWLILGAIVLASARDEVTAHTRCAINVFQALSGCEEPAYRSYWSWRFGSLVLEMSESQLKRKVSIRSQRMSVACTAFIMCISGSSIPVRSRNS